MVPSFGGCTTCGDSWTWESAKPTLTLDVQKLPMSYLTSGWQSISSYLDSIEHFDAMDVGWGSSPPMFSGTVTHVLTYDLVLSSEEIEDIAATWTWTLEHVGPEHENS